MKTSQLRQIIKEEIDKALNDKINQSFNDKVGVKPVDPSIKNVMKEKPTVEKPIHIEFTTKDKVYKTFVDGKQEKQNEVKELIEKLTGITFSLYSPIDDAEKEEIRDALKNKDVTFTWNDTMDVS